MSTLADAKPVPAPTDGFLERTFALTARGTTVGTEVRAGLTTFMVMSYIIVVNAVILTTGTQIAGQNLPFTAVVTATCLTAGLLTLLMGLWANFPLALAPGMGLNSVVAFQLVAGQGLPWQAAMGVIFLEGVIITLLVLTGFREAVMTALPHSLKMAIGGGIGLFLLAIGAYEGGLFRVPVEVGQTIQMPPPTAGALGNLVSPPTVLAIVGLLVTAWLLARGVKGGLLIGILLTTVVGMIWHYGTGAAVSTVPGKAVLPAQWISLPDFGTLGAGLNLEVFVRLGVLAALLTILAIMLSDFFDTLGTVVAVGKEANLLDEQGRPPHLDRILLVDSLGAALGGAAGSSSNTCFIESAAGVAEGGRTGLAAVVTAIPFFLAMFLANVFAIVPPEATAAALIIVGFFMMAAVGREIPWTSIEEGLPALLTLTIMPLTWSITNGIGVGIVLYVFLKAVNGKLRAVHPLMWVAAAAFVIYFAFWRA
ncbi:MAG TPA: NCS2 family permease [Chloroflexota bacterium]